MFEKVPSLYFCGIISIYRLTDIDDITIKHFYFLLFLQGLLFCYFLDDA